MAWKTIAKQSGWSGSMPGSCCTSILTGLAACPATWLRVSFATECTEISLRPDCRAGARPLSQVANATFGSGRYLVVRITPKPYCPRSAPGTEHWSWFDSRMGRRRGLDPAISCSEAWAHELQSHSWVANTRRPRSEWGPSQDRTASWRQSLPRLRAVAWRLRPGLRSVRPRWGCRALPCADSAIFSRVSPKSGRTQRFASRDVCWTQG